MIEMKIITKDVFMNLTPEQKLFYFKKVHLLCKFLVKAAGRNVKNLTLILSKIQFTRRSHPWGPWIEASEKFRTLCQAE